jgi:hypothetical protein
MSTLGGPNNFGLWPNADFRNGNANEWSLGTYNATGGPNGDDPYIELTGGGGSGWTGGRVEVDFNATYRMVCYAKTFSPGSSGNNAGGHIGFACYDENDNFIDLRHLKGIGDTQLTRTATPGDTTIYVADASGWYNGSTGYFRGLMLFGGQYPYSEGYTRYAVTSNGYNENGMTNLGNGEWSVTLPNGLGTYSDVLVNGSYPIGTYLSNGRAGGSYNYALGAPTYPTTWTRYDTGNFTGTSRNSGTPFRYGTKYVRFLILRNYNRRTESPQDHVWGISKIFFGKVTDGRVYDSSRV